MVQAASDPVPEGANVEGAPDLDARRPGSQYEMPTAEKRAFGARMRRAREVAGLTLTEAAAALGYSQPVQLSYQENGQRFPPLRVLLGLSELYGTTMDYLCGMAPDPDPDPAVGAQALVAARVTAEVRSMIQLMTTASVDVVRELRPDAGRQMRLAGLVIEASVALGKLRVQHPEFDDLHASATLASKLDVAADLARDHLAGIERTRRRMAGCRLMDLATDPAHDTTVERPQGFELHRLRPLRPDALAADDWTPPAPSADDTTRATA